MSHKKNQIMKKYIVYLFIFFTANLLILAGCSEDFLNQEPQTSLSSNQVFESLDNVQPFLNGLYFKFRSTRVNRTGFFLMLGMDESQQGEYQIRTDADQAGLDKYDGFYNPDNKPIASLWNIRWPVVVKASQAIAILQQKKQTAGAEDLERIDYFMGQALFYKSAVLFELASYWGELPVPETDGTEVSLSAKKPLNDVYNTIINDLNLAKTLLHPISTEDVRIPTSWAAVALLGKVYMSAPQESGYRNYDSAYAQFNDIYKNGGFSLVNNFADLWDPERSSGKEGIFTFYFNNKWPDTNEAQWYTGSRACSGNPTNYLGGYDLLLPTEYCRTDVSMGGLWEDGDLRKMESIRYDFVNGSLPPAVYAGFGEDQLYPHIRKYEDIRLNLTESFYNSGKNMYYIRFADVLLMLAECMNEQGNTSGAVDLVNKSVRARAWGGALPLDKAWDMGMSQDQFRTSILDERMRELCFEGWRRFDLIRTRQFTTLIPLRNRWAKESGSIADYQMKFPIPLVEIKQNPNLSFEDQNLGY